MSKYLILLIIFFVIAYSYAVMQPDVSQKMSQQGTKYVYVVNEYPQNVNHYSQQTASSTPETLKYNNSQIGNNQLDYYTSQYNILKKNLQ